MSIIRKIAEFFFGSDNEQRRMAALLVYQMKTGTVSNWYDVDDFLHRGFLSRRICDAGELCGYLARAFPGKISGMFSKEALGYLQRLEDALGQSTENLEHTIRCIVEDVYAETGIESHLMKR